MRATLTQPIPTVSESPMTPILKAGRAMGIRANATIYAMAEENRFPIGVERIGNRWMVRTSELRRFLGLDD